MAFPVASPSVSALPAVVSRHGPGEGADGGGAALDRREADRLLCETLLAPYGDARGPLLADALLPERTVFYYGRACQAQVRPAVLLRRFGNGRRLLALMPIKYPPHYYLLWIDDRWDLDATLGPECLRAHVPDILDQIEEEFGRPDTDEESGEPIGDFCWPEADFELGCSWAEADADDVLPGAGKVLDGDAGSSLAVSGGDGAGGFRCRCVVW